MNTSSASQLPIIKDVDLTQKVEKNSVPIGHWIEYDSTYFEIAYLHPREVQKQLLEAARIKNAA